MFGFFRKKDNIMVDYSKPASSNDNTKLSVSGPGKLEVEDVFSIKGRGTIVTGRVDDGSFRINDKVVIRKPDGSEKISSITGIEAFRRSLDLAQQGDNCGLLLSDITRNDVGRGDMVEKVI